MQLSPGPEQPAPRTRPSSYTQPPRAGNPVGRKSGTQSATDHVQCKNDQRSKREAPVSTSPSEQQPLPKRSHKKKSLSAAFAEASPSLLPPPPPKVFAEISTQTEIESVLAVAVPVPTYTGATLFQVGLITTRRVS